MSTQPNTPAPTPGQGGTAGDTYEALFDAAYIASKPPIFGPFYTGTLTQPQRWALFNILLTQGYTLDEQIEGEGWGPYETMYFRTLYGDQWVLPGQGDVASATEPQTVNTGAPPPGAIITTLALLPPYVPPAAPVVPTPPAPPAPTPMTSPVVSSIIVWGTPPSFTGTEFKSQVNDGWVPGQTWTGTITVGGVTFTGNFEKISNLFYNSWLFTAAVAA